MSTAEHLCMLACVALVAHCLSPCVVFGVTCSMIVAMGRSTVIPEMSGWVAPPRASTVASKPCFCPHAEEREHGEASLSKLKHSRKRPHSSWQQRGRLATSPFGAQEERREGEGKESVSDGGDFYTLSAYRVAFEDLLVPPPRQADLVLQHILSPPSTPASPEELDTLAAAWLSLTRSGLLRWLGVSPRSAYARQKTILRAESAQPLARSPPLLRRAVGGLALTGRLKSVLQWGWAMHRVWWSSPPAHWRGVVVGPQCQPSCLAVRGLAG